MVPQGAQLAFAAACILILSLTCAACPGTVTLANPEGSQTVTIIQAAGAGQVDVWNGQVITHIGGRAYFAETCMEGWCDHNKYLGPILLGKTFRFTTDMAGAGCGCCASLYLVPMKQNTQPCNSNDYYCDANSLCGVRCTEIDLQESNQYGWRSTLHSGTDAWGVGMGFGGQAKDWNKDEYGPGAKCIDTQSPFDAAVSFPIDNNGALAAMEVTLSQKGHSCTLTANISNYKNMAEISSALAAGVTPVASYWTNNEMGWLDQPPCEGDNPGACANSVKYYGFSIENMANPIWTTTTVTHSTTTTSTTTATTSLGTTTTVATTSLGTTTTVATTSLGTTINVATTSLGATISVATTSLGTTAVATTSLVTNGFCCVGAQKANDACSTCFQNAIEAGSTYCGKSKSNCLSCGHRSTWCETSTLSDGLRERANRVKNNGSLQPTFDETLKQGKRQDQRDML